MHLCPVKRWGSDDCIARLAEDARVGIDRDRALRSNTATSISR